MSATIHPAAFVDPAAQLADGVVVGPGAVVGPHVRVGAGTRIDAHALITGWTTIGANCHFHHGAVAGSPPQDLKFAGEASYLEIGDRTVMREYATANLATEPGATTRVGSDCLLMAYSHIAHNCQVGDRVIVANAVQLAGYVAIGDWAIVGGGSVVHQFTRIGAHAMIGGGSRVVQDVPPYVKTAGNPPRLGGTNSIGLQRRGYSPEAIAAVDRAYRIFFRGGHTVSRAVAVLRETFPDRPEVELFARFCETSVRGIGR